MNRKTLLEFIGVLVLAAVAVGIGWHRLRPSEGPESDLPPPTPTPRMRSLLQELDPGDLPAASSPASAPRRAERQPLPTDQQATGFLVVEVREADGSIPMDPVKLVNPLIGFEREVTDGRLAMESLPGPVSFYVESIGRVTDMKTATVLPDTSTAMTFFLPEPELEPASIGLQLVAAENFYQVAAVVEGSPADKAGLRPGDAVIAVNGVAIELFSPEQIANALVGVAGESVVLTVVIQDEAGVFEEVQVVLTFTPEG